MNTKSPEFVEKLKEYSQKYIDLCIQSTKQVATGSGKIVEVKERHIPTIEYFLTIWLPRNLGETISRVTYYEWLREDFAEKTEVVKMIDTQFKALAGDIVANEQKGIFYAKNKLGWTDKLISDNTNTNHNITVEVVNTNIPLSKNEGEIKQD